MFRSYLVRAVFAILLAAPASLLAQESKTGAFAKAEPPKAALTKLAVHPAKIELTGPRDEQRIGIVGEYADGRTWELTPTAKYKSANPRIADVDANGIVRPIADGETSIEIQAGALRQTIPVKVTKAAADELVAFTREILPILTRAGCNQGACHGAQHGRGGFRLSLLGFDPLFDHAQIVQSAEGRRVVLSDPERSILLMKPALAMEHGGGERFKINSREYTYLKRWLEDGAPEPSAKDPEVTSIEVWPARRIMVPGETQQLIVKATWKDGKTEDVTATAQFDTLNDGVAKVTPAGLVTANGRGETHIMVRFCGQATVAQVTLPYAKLDKYPDVAKNNFIDEKLIAKWKDLGLTPSPLCNDEDFFRRIHLDAIGTLPTPAEIKAFMADKSPDKRAKAIDKVLDRPEFVDFWALKWGDLLRINRDSMNERGMWSFHNWVRGQLRDGKGVDEMVRDIITAEGSTYTEGPANFFITSTSPADWAETTSQLFLGVRIGCAKCHHHPFEKWSQDDYYSMTAFFVRLGTKNSQEFGIFGRERVVYLKSAGEQTHPRKGGVVKSRPLDGDEMNDPIDRRVKLAEWMTSPKNPFFAKNIVNRFWGYMMGRGLVEPLDDVRATNPASNPELLDELAADFVQHKYDLKHLLRTVMNSRAYQLSSIKIPANEADASNVHYTRFTVRRLTAEQLADALDYATGTQEKYAGLPLGTRAIQLPDSRVKSYLLDVFGRPPRQVTCECERVTQPNIAQALHLLNGDALGKKIATPTGRIDTLLKAKKSHEQIVEELYLVTLSRVPNADEIDRANRWIREAATPREGLQDLLWVLLNSREFTFNH
ncbi:MAG TPA: DUF1553 domain-containing protein [Gemmataceae bacterium]|nr:DUF1553 domain-containing protein [Gemmataceae bacterium]